LTVSSVIVRLSSASSLSSSSVARSAGTARRITALRSWPRAATPVPSSLRRMRSRSRWGRRSTLLTRSVGMVEYVRSTGMVDPGLRTAGLRPGLQSMKYSPISDWGRDSQVTSVCSRRTVGDVNCTPASAL
jgi:hypothetical protein